MGIDNRLLTLNGNSPNLGGVNAVVRTAAANYPLSSIEDMVFADTTANVVAYTAPDPSVKGRAVTFVKTNAGANGITVAAYGAETFNGSAGPYTLPNSDTAAKGCWTLTSDGTNWTLTSTANTATSSSGTVAGQCVAGGIVNGVTGVVSNAFGGFAKVSHSAGDPAYLFSYTALSAGFTAIGVVTTNDQPAVSDPVSCYAFSNTSNGTCRVYQLDPTSTSNPQLYFNVCIFAVPS